VNRIAHADAHTNALGSLDGRPEVDVDVAATATASPSLVFGRFIAPPVNLVPDPLEHFVQFLEEAAAFLFGFLELFVDRAFVFVVLILVAFAAAVLAPFAAAFADGPSSG